MPEVTVKRCIIVGCDWAHELKPPTPSGDHVRDLLQHNGWLGRVERGLEAHLKTHSLVEWAQTVMIWKSRSEAASAKLLEQAKELEKEKRCPSLNPSCAKTYRR